MAPESGCGTHEVSILMVAAGQVLGSAPRAKVSMMVMGPPQQRQRSRSSAFPISAEGAGGLASVRR